MSQGQSAAVWKDQRDWRTPEGYVDTTAGESLPAPRQSEVIGPRRDTRIAEGRMGSNRVEAKSEKGPRNYFREYGMLGACIHFRLLK